MPKKKPGVFLSARFLPLLTLFILAFAISSPEIRGQDQPTVISNVKVEPSPFSPNNDGLNETTKFSFTLSEDSRVTIEIVWFSSPVVVSGKNLFVGNLLDTLRLSDQNKPFASNTIFSDTSAKAGLNEFTWDGIIKVNNVLTQMPDSTYTYLIRAEDLDTNDQDSTKPVTGEVSIDSKPPVISSVSVSPNPFSPDNNGINDYARIKFTLTGLPNNAFVGTIGFEVVTIVDVATLQLDQAATTPAFYNSDSLEVRFAPIRLQFIKRSLNKQAITFRVSGWRVLDSGDTIAVSTGTISIDPNDVLGKVYQDPNGAHFSLIDNVEDVNGSGADNISNSVDIYTSAGAVRVDVNNSLNETASSGLPLDPPFIGNGIYEASLGPSFADDTYTYTISAADESGNLVKATGTVTAVSTPISVTNLQVVPDSISPADANNRFDFATISYKLNRAGNVTLQIFRDSTAFVSNNLVRTLLSNSSQDAGSHTQAWDGKNDAGSYLSLNSQRAYRIIISVFDPLTFQTSETRGLVVVDNQKPAFMLLDPLPARTRGANLTVSGRTETGDSVAIILNGSGAAFLTADSLGLFSASIALGNDGLKKINAVSFDGVKNGPTRSDTLSVILDTRAPVVTDTLVRAAGVKQRLLGSVLLGFGPSDTVELRISDGTGGRVSGVNLNQTSVNITGPSGSDIEGKTLYVKPDTLRFVPSENITQVGTCILKAIFSDSLENSDSISVSFRVGEPAQGPSLVSATAAAAFTHDGFLNSRLDQQANIQWVFDVAVSDNSGTGIDAASSSLELYYQATGKKIGGSSKVQGGTLSFSVSDNIATDGSMDGIFRLKILVNDNDPTSGALVDSVSFFNDTQRPDTLSFKADSSRVTVNLADIQPGSGVLLLNSRITVTDPAGAALQTATYTNNGDSTLFASFDPPLSTPGIYKVNLQVADRAGNSRVYDQITFRVGAPPRTPALVSAAPTAAFAHNGFLNSLLDQPAQWIFNVTVADNSGTGIDTSSSSSRLELYYHNTGKKIGGRSTVLGSTLSFTVSDNIATDGSMDGFYLLLIKVNDNDPTTDALQTFASFFNDTQRPDTLSFKADSSRVTVVLKDVHPGSGVSLLASRINSVTDPTGAALPTVTYTNNGDSTLFASFDPPLRTSGIYSVNLHIEDKAGNSRDYPQLGFVIGNVNSRPVVTQVSAPFDTVVNEAGLTQPLAVTLTLVDNSGTGLDFGNSLLKLFSPDSSEVTGTVTSTSPTSLTYTAGRLLSNDGSEDGRFILLAHIVDRMPVTGDLDTSFTFVYDTRRPAITEVKYSSDTSSVTVKFEDLPARPGRASAGIVLQSAVAEAADPAGAAIAARTSHDGVSRLTLIFDGGKPADPGVYRLTFSVIDRAGNTLDSAISIPLNVVGQVELFPPDSSVVTGPLSRVYARVKGTVEPLNPGAARTLTVSQFGVFLPGTTALAGDTLVFDLADTLRTDGSADGLYEVRADLDIPELGSRSIARGIFTFDNVAPDTEAVEVLFEADNVRALVRFTDGGVYPAVSGINTDSTKVAIEDPRGNLLQPKSTVWTGGDRLEARFDRLEIAGLHRLRIDIRDRAGLRTLYRAPVVNAGGGTAGRSVAFVDEVPARTSARINFFSGQSGKRIQRAVLRIFNLRGDLIRRLDVTDRIEGGGGSVTAEWLLENDGGSLVTNGVFIYYWEVTFDDGSTERIRKTLAVARR